MCWLTLTDASGQDICVNMDNILQFESFKSPSGTNTLLMSIVNFADSTKNLHVRETISAIQHKLKTMGEKIICSDEPAIGAQSSARLDWRSAIPEG